MARKIVLINGHPDASADHFCAALADAYAAGADSRGYSVRRIDIAQLEFPILRSQADFESRARSPAIEDAQDALMWSDHVVIIFPLWLGTMPALLKAFLEQVLRPGFVFDARNGDSPKQRLKGRSARIVVTMGMPGLVYRWYFRAHGLKNLKRNILAFCGFHPVRDSVFGMVEAVSDHKRRAWLEGVGKMGARCA